MKEEWEYKKTFWSDVLTIINGKNQSAVLASDGQFPIYGSGGIMGYANDYLCPENTVVIGRKGSINKPLFVTSKFWNVDTAFGLCANKDVLNPKYLYYFCLDYNFERHNKAVTIPSLTKKDLLKIEIKLPSLGNQNSVVSELDQINDLIRLKKEQLKEYDNLAQSIFYGMFGDPVENEKGWEVKKLKDVSKVKIGPFGSLLHVEDYVEGGYPVINPVHMNGGRIVADMKFSVSEGKYKELSSYILKENDIVFGRRGDIGRCAIVSKYEDGFVCGTGSLFVRFGIVVNTTYILKMLLTNSVKSLLISKAKGATMLNINCGIVENLQIPLPPLPLQQEFSSRIEQIEKLKTEVQKTITDLETLLASRMQYWFE